MSTAAASSAHLEFDTAASALQAAVVAALTDAAAHEALVVAVLETGTDTDGAAAILRRSIELAPANGGTKCPYLAQLGRHTEAKEVMRGACEALLAGVFLPPAPRLTRPRWGRPHPTVLVPRVGVGCGGDGGVTDWGPAADLPALELRIAAGKKAVEVGLQRPALALLGGVVE
ncbi:hypothetical protein I4F81_001650 [Pyropia yezoensis]|uniref:Uncharacterized protein n=1 Tax=Pyropia yezoensis TaxID=2788 RepID=A0ACC3BMB2_PYRYE|nr:hypothetical protein I4F81_001650 [Neopyropia yezoensis]